MHIFHTILLILFVASIGLMAFCWWREEHANASGIRVDDYGDYVGFFIGLALLAVDLVGWLIYWAILHFHPASIAVLAGTIAARNGGILESLGIIHETAEQTRVITPFADGLIAFKAHLATAAQKGAKLRTMIYGCTLQPFFDALIAAKEAGADVKVIFDHTQAGGRAEAPQIERIISAGLVDGENFLIGTSPLHHQIVHLKATVIWTPDGKVVVEDGSWNYSPSASLQMNDLCFTASPGLAAYYDQAFEKLWAWVQQNEQQYQKKATAGSPETA